MADDSSQPVLTKFSLDLTDFNSAVQEAKETLQGLAQEEKDNVTASQAATAKAIDSVKEQIALQKQLQEEANTVAAKAKAGAAEIDAQTKADERAAKQAEEASAALLRQKRLDEQAAKTLEAQTRAAAEAKLKQAMIETEASKKAAIQKKQDEESQQAELRKTILLIKEKEAAEKHEEAHHHGGEHHEGGGLLGMLGIGGEAAKATTEGVTKIAGAAGAGAAELGALSGALTGFGEAGMGIFAIEQVGEGIEKLVDKVKELVLEAGKLDVLQNTFERLAEGKGIKDSTELMEKLRKATHDQVGDMELLRTANTFLRSSMKISDEQMIALTASTVKLAKASGQDAGAAIQALNRFFLTGRSMSLAMVTGIQRQELAVKGLGSALTEAERRQANFNKAQEVITKRAAAIGTLPETLAGALKGYKTVSGRVEEAFGLGMERSEGMKSLIKSIQGATESLGGLEGAFEKIGTAVGNALGKLSLFVDLMKELAGPIFNAFKDAFASAGSVIENIFSTAIKAASVVLKNVLGAAMDLVDGHLYRTKEHVNDMAQAFATAHPILDLFGKTIATLAGILGGLANVLKLVADVAASTPDTFGKAFTDWYASQKDLTENVKKTIESFEEAGGLLTKKIETTGEVDALKKDIAEAEKAYEEKKKLHKLSAQEEAEYLDQKKQFQIRAGVLGQQAYDEEVIGINKQYEVLTKAEAQQKEMDARAASLAAAPSTLVTNEQVMKTKVAGIGLGTKYVQASNGNWVLKENLSDYEKALEGAKGAKDVLKKTGAIEPPPDKGDDEKGERKLEKDIFAERRAALQKSVAEEKEYLAQARADEDQEYKTGLEGYKAYFDHRRELARADTEMQRNKAKEDYQITVDSLAAKLKHRDIRPDQYAVEMQTAKDKLETTLTGIETAGPKAQRAIDKEERAADERDQIQQVEFLSARKTAALKEEQQQTEKANKENLISDKEYVAERTAQILGEVDRVRQAEDAKQAIKQAHQSWDLNAIDAREKAIQAAILNARNQLQQLADSALERPLQKLQKAFSDINSELDARLNIAKLGPSGIALAGDPKEIQQQMMTANRAQISSLEDLLERAKPYSNTWFEIYNHILSATQQQAQLNEQLRESQDILRPIGEMFGDISQQLSGLFGSQYAKGLESALSGVSKQFGNMEKFTDMLSGKGGGVQADPRLEAIIKTTDAATGDLIAAGRASATGIEQYTQPLLNEIASLTRALKALEDQAWSMAHPGEPVPGETASGSGQAVGVAAGQAMSDALGIPVTHTVAHLAMQPTVPPPPEPFRIPEIFPPTIAAPEMPQIPDIAAPDIAAPKIPSIEAPSIPDIELPKIATPKVPDIEAPKVPIEAPSDSAMRLESSAMSLERSAASLDKAAASLGNIGTSFAKEIQPPKVGGVSVHAGIPGVPHIHEEGVGSALPPAAATLESYQHAPAVMPEVEEAPTIAQGKFTDSGFKEASNGLADFTEHVKNAATKVEGLVGAFGGFMDTISHAGSKGAGALGGLMGGAGLGGQVGGAMESMKGFFGMSTALAGPIGQAVGAAAGMVTGMISGQKQEKITDEINKLNLSFKTLTDNLSANKASLASTITGIQSLMAEAQAQMATSKKGHGQYADLIKQYNEQLKQLQNQADQTMADMAKQLSILGQPTAYQDIENQLDGIIQQYEKFAGAAQTTQQLAQANQFLAESLQQFSIQEVDTLRQNEQDQIQNALQLNQLYNQRNQLQYQYLQQIMQIQGQGALTRTQTKAQSGYAQFYQAQVNYAQQMDQINQQIALSQYQLTAAQKIFNLAQSKAGLEAQVLQLQEVGIDKDMARIAALQNVLGTLQQANYNIVTGTPANPTQQAQMILQLLLSLLGPGQATTGGGATTGQSSSTITQLYAQLSALGVGSLRGQGL